jgi:hypothetical protein
LILPLVTASPPSSLEVVKTVEIRFADRSELDLFSFQHLIPPYIHSGTKELPNPEYLAGNVRLKAPRISTIV